MYGWLPSSANTHIKYLHFGLFLNIQKISLPTITPLLKYGFRQWQLGKACALSQCDQGWMWPVVQDYYRHNKCQLEFSWGSGVVTGSACWLIRSMLVSAFMVSARWAGDIRLMMCTMVSMAISGKSWKFHAENKIIFHHEHKMKEK